MKGVIHISVSLILNQDLDEEQIQDLLSEMDYNFEHINIEETRINGEID